MEITEYQLEELIAIISPYTELRELLYWLQDQLHDCDEYELSLTDAEIEPFKAAVAGTELEWMIGAV